MKKISFFLIAIIAAAGLLITGCTKDSDLNTPENNTILPDNLAVDIPSALSYEGNLKSAAKIDTIIFW